MGCTHVPDCPLFPKLNASLRGWRDAYCDSDSAWHDCARYKRSQTGGAVPLALLPNGRMAQVLTRARPTAGSPPSRFQVAPVQVATGGVPFEREGPEPDSPPVRRASAVAERGGALVATPVRQSPAGSAPEHDHRPGRWARLVAWLRGAV